MQRRADEFLNGVTIDAFRLLFHLQHLRPPASNSHDGFMGTGQTAYSSPSHRSKIGRPSQSGRRRISSRVASRTFKGMQPMLLPVQPGGSCRCKSVMTVGNHGDSPQSVGFW